MPSKPREWPNKARFARDESAVLANEIERLLMPLLGEKPLTESQVISLASRAVVKASKIQSLMAEQGAPVRQG